MTSINYNEFQPGQGVSAPALNENFTLTNNAMENMELTLNSAISSLTSTTTLKADKNGSSTESFYVADATEETQAVNLRQLNASALTVIGSVIWYAGSSAPDGYLLCDGSDVSRETYSDLFNVIGVRYGAGDSANTFTLPNLIGKFAEGALSAGTYKNAGLPNITGRICGEMGTYPNGAFHKTGTTEGSTATSGSSVDDTYAFDASRCSSVYGRSSTVQPASLTLLPCIKY
ncbi:MAG: phage tail protein [bacterium]|nr:phage tail protein [bacterium]